MAKILTIIRNYKENNDIVFEFNCQAFDFFSYVNIISKKYKAYWKLDNLFETYLNKYNVKNIKNVKVYYTSKKLLFIKKYYVDIEDKENLFSIITENIEIEPIKNNCLNCKHFDKINKQFCYLYKKPVFKNNCRDFEEID